MSHHPYHHVFNMLFWKMVVLCCGIMVLCYLSVHLSCHPSKFSGYFFNMLWDTNLKLGKYLWWVAQHIKFEFHCNQITLTLLDFTAKSKLNAFFTFMASTIEINPSNSVPRSLFVSFLTQVHFLQKNWHLEFSQFCKHVSWAFTVFQTFFHIF